MAAFAARYARALADVAAHEHLDRAVIESQLADFGAAWKESSDLREVFLDPTIPSEQKIAILDKLNERMALSVQVRNFLAVLIDHARLNAFSQIVKEFRHEMNRRIGIAEVEITTARALGEEERHALASQIGSRVGKQVSATYHVDESLLGGVIARVGSTVYDGSVRGRLERLEDQLVKN
ncbi:ATP synthase F1 subunit delta [Silvibacterium acidisoli]|uniref:ATP synthase F1 subunit delta n=1 Tax=Acidobacteriaceae bacterium ZG23-2 TaxID=2883246 RepID=UPI00406CCCBB